MNDFSDKEDELFPITDAPDLIKKIPELVENPPQRRFHNILDLFDFWDHLSKGPSPTTDQAREALRKDMEEQGLSD